MQALFSHWGIFSGKSRTIVALAGWVLIILIAGLYPLSNFVGHAHWDNIAWTIRPQLWHSRRLYFDMVANVWLFYPLGVLLARVLPASIRARSAWIIGAGAILSLGIESFQVYCHNRHPSLYDLASNTLGTALGVWTSSRLFALRFVNDLLPSHVPHTR